MARVDFNELFMEPIQVSNWMRNMSEEDVAREAHEERSVHGEWTHENLVTYRME